MAGDFRGRLPAIVRAVQENDLTTFASAISFRVLFAIPPFLLFLLGLLGFLHLSEVWTEDLAPEIRPEISRELFAVVDETVRKVVGSKHLFWVTLGAAIALWEVSGAVRAVARALDRVYCEEDERGAGRFLRSIVIAVPVAACLVAATVVVRFGPLLVSSDGPPVSVLVFVGRWGLGVALMFLAVGLLVHYAPTTRRPLRWVSFGSLLVTVAWVLTSLGFGWYLTSIASYGSAFGSLASVIVVMTYVYVSTIAFLVGVQIDALVREEVEGRPTGG